MLAKIRKSLKIESKVTQDYLNLYRVFRPLYLTLSIFGMMPYSLRYNKSKQIFLIVQKSIYVNSLCAISTLLVIVVFFLGHIQDLFGYNENNSMTDAILTQLNYALELSTLAIYCCVLYICVYHNREKYNVILSTLNSAFIELGNDITDGIFKKLRQKVSFVLWLQLFLLLMQLSVNYTREDGVWKMLLVMMSFNFPQIIQMLSLSFYFVLVMMVISVLTGLNQRLCNQAKLPIVPYSNNYVKVISKQGNLNLRQLELVYAKAFQVKREINEVFQGPILVSTLQCFHSIVSEAYIIYHGLVGKSHSTHVIVNCSIWIGYQFLKVYSLAYSGNLLKEETMKIGQNLHDIPIDKQDLPTMLEVQHFTSLMSYQGTFLTVYGYYPLDATLMSTMIATATMYLIILVQFDKTNEFNLRA